MLALPFGNITANFLTGQYAANPTGAGVAYFIQNIVNAAFLVAGLVTFAFLIMGGFRYLTAGGDVKATEAAVKIITNAVLGLTIVIGAYALARIVATLFGIDIFHPIFKGP